MSTDDKEILSAIRAQLADRIGWRRFQLWFTGQSRLRLADQRVVVEVGTPFLQEWLRKQFRNDLEAVIADVLDPKAIVEFHVAADLVQPQRDAANEPPESPPSLKLADAPRPKDGIDSQTAAVSAAFPSQGPARRRAEETFERFVACPGNRLAFSSAQHCVERPGEMSPLVLCGPTGVGKTHLLESIRGAAAAAKRHALYLTAEQFTTHFLEALNGKGLPSFRRKHRGVEILILDDVQFFAGKRATLVELLYTVDTVLKAGGQLVLACDRPPTELAGLGRELSARLAGGLVCRMEPPDFAARTSIVSRMAERMKMELPAEVAGQIAAHAASHARELAGALNRLRAASLAHGRPISRELASEALAELATHNGRVVRLADIQHAVCEEFGLSAESLQSGRKAHSVSYPRMLAMFLARKHTRSALSEIGHFFGRRSHSTVISAHKKVEGWMSQNRTVQLAERSWNVEDALRRVEDRLKA